MFLNHSSLSSPSSSCLSSFSLSVYPVVTLLLLFPLLLPFSFPFNSSLLPSSFPLLFVHHFSFFHIVIKIVLLLSLPRSFPFSFCLFFRLSPFFLIPMPPPRLPSPLPNLSSNFLLPSLSVHLPLPRLFLFFFSIPVLAQPFLFSITFPSFPLFTSS